MERNNNGRDKEGTIDRATFLWLAPTTTGHISDLEAIQGYLWVSILRQAGLMVDVLDFIEGWVGLIPHSVGVHVNRLFSR
jgi:hypothetical protein